MNKFWPKLLVFTLIWFILPSTFAVKNDSRGLVQDSYTRDSHTRLKKKHISKRNVEQLYMVMLEEEPLATYKGNIPGLSATSLSVNTVNKREKSHVLNVHSQDSKRYLNYLSRQQESVLERSKNMLKRNISIKNKYQIALNSFTANLSLEESILLKTVEGINKVIKIKKSRIMSDSGPAYIKAPSAWDGSATGINSKAENVIVGILDTGISPFHPSFADVGGDQYNHTNPLGDGVYLGDCAKAEFAHYCNDKLIGIWSHPDILHDYTPHGDDLIAIDHNGHGSHTASIVAGNIIKDVAVFNVMGKKGEYAFSQISGVAPHANVVSYQVCDSAGGCWPDIVVLAIEHAIANGVQVINYSVGSDAEDPWYNIESKAFLAAREAGIHVAASAGNTGPDPETVVSPGNAPWLTSVAAYSHDRNFTEKKVSFNGGSFTLANIKGLAATSGISGVIVDAVNYGDGSCLSPFSPNTFAGEIVVCRRGGIPRVTKGSNVLVGGAGGLILINVVGDEENLVADFHVLPAIQINAEEGVALVNWLAAGSNHSANIDDSVMMKDAQVADIAGVFSSRGPELIYNQWLTPNVAAPGINIYGANSQYQPWFDAGDKTESPYIFLDGTSMASPHVAGALALIVSLKPHWTPAQAQSAIMLSSNATTMKEDGLTPSSLFDSGAGSIRIDNALKAGLIMDVTNQEYLDAEPELGGDATSLNLASAVKTDCALTCTWRRTFTATANSSWTVSSDSDVAGFSISASPSSFTLAQGESITIEIKASIGQGYDSEYGMSRLILTPDNKELSVSSLPVVGSFGLGEFPLDAYLETSKDVGYAKIAGVKTIGTNNLQLNTFALTEVEVINTVIPRDDSDMTYWPLNVYNDLRFLYSQALIIPEGIKRLVVRVSSTSSPDLDLYVGRDYNNNGRPNNSYEMKDVICSSATIKTLESCEVNNPPPGTYYLAVHNYGDFDKPTAGNDFVNLELAMIGQDDSSITLDYKQSVNALEDINLTVNWNKDLLENTLYMTVIDIGTTIDTPDDVGIMPIEIYRNAKAAALINGLNDFILSAEEKSIVNLSALASIEANPYDNLNYYWRQVSGPLITIQDEHALNLSITMPSVESNQTVVIELVVISNGVESVPATASLTVLNKSSRSGGTVQYPSLLFVIFLMRIWTRSYSRVY